MTERRFESTAALIAQFPELQDPGLRLRETIENGDWHVEDSVYGHTMSVVGNLQTDLNLGFVADKRARARLNEQLGSKVGRISRRETLMLAALFHDVGKPETIKRGADGRDSCPGHEAKSAEMARGILVSHAFDEADTSRVCAIIANHGLPHGITNPNLPEQARKNIYAHAKTLKPSPDQADILLELMLLGLADTQGSQLKDKNAKEFSARVEKYHKILGSGMDSSPILTL